MYIIEPSPTEGTHGKGIDNEPLNSSQQEGAPEECVQKEVEYENSSQRKKGKQSNDHYEQSEEDKNKH